MVLAVAVVDGGTLVGEGKRRRTEEGGAGAGWAVLEILGKCGNVFSVEREKEKLNSSSFFFNWA
jgi:hypothetical protein